MITLDELRRFKVGDKVTIYKLNIYNEPFAMKGTLMSDEFNEWGYYEVGSGWGLSRSYDSELVCYELRVRLYKNRNIHQFKTGYEIIDIKKGWGE